MHNFATLGASALVLALGVAQASAQPTNEQIREWTRAPAYQSSVASAQTPALLKDSAGYMAYFPDDPQQVPTLHVGR
jgi:hypothetical protein